MLDALGKDVAVGEPLGFDDGIADGRDDGRADVDGDRDASVDGRVEEVGWALG